MKRIPKIEENLKALQPKLDIGARDWTHEEKKMIEESYFEITKVSVGWGRTVDMGCDTCVQSAVNIILNYQAKVQRSEKGEETQHGSGPVTTLNWRDTHRTIDAEAASRGFQMPKEAKTKEEKIKALEDHIAKEDAVKPHAYTKEQLAEVIKALTGEEVNPDDFTYEELLATVNEIENDQDGDTEE